MLQSKGVMAKTWVYRLTRGVLLKLFAAMELTRPKAQHKVPLTEEKLQCALP
jgi:hypothetical protein